MHTQPSVAASDNGSIRNQRRHPVDADSADEQPFLAARREPSGPVGEAAVTNLGPLAASEDVDLETQLTVVTSARLALAVEDHLDPDAGVLEQRADMRRDNLAGRRQRRQR